MMKALLLVDIQNDFLPGGALPVAEGDQVVPVANELMHKGFDVVVASKDWHPRDHVSFAENHGKMPGEVIAVGGEEQILWPVHCVQEGDGADFAPGLEVDGIDAVFFKGEDPMIDSYSAFFDNARQRSTGLGDELKGRGIGEVYVAGLATDYCVKFSVMDALALGFKVTVVVDGCRGVNLNPGDVDQALKDMQAAGARVVTSAEV